MQKYLGITAFILALAASPALAQNWVGLLKNTPAERFDEEDLRLFLDNARKALNEGQDNQSKGRPCKEVQLHNEAGGRKGDSKLSLCQVDGKWRLLSAQQLKK